MVLSFDQIILLIGLGFTLAAPLGPVNAEIIRKSTQHKLGWGFGILTGFGAMTGDFVIATSILYLGNEIFLEFIEIKEVKIGLLLLNIFVLSFIAYMGLKVDYASLAKEQRDKVSQYTLGKIGKQYVLGFAIVVTSPWSYLWWTSFGTVILESDIPLGDNLERLIVTMFFLAGIAFWIVLITFTLAMSHKVAEPRFLIYIQKIAALIIAVFALKLVYDVLIIIV
ncbi:MAG: LysE family transporter [Candidatus Heimdallarchaeota archaeon]|nr:LysE family transporter [Candidatus Heimdallarchaeota archaeon]